VVIPTLGGPSLAGTIDRLNAGTLVPAEILVCVPNGSAGKVASLIASNVRIIETAQRGQVAQRIEGFKTAQYDYVLQIDDDVDVDPHCLQRLVDAVEASGGKASAAAALRHSGTDQSAYSRYRKSFAGKLYYFLLNGSRGYAPGTVTAAGTEIGLDPGSSSASHQDVEWLPGGCVLHKRDNLVLTNYYPHSGKAYCEDLYHSRALAKKRVGMWIATDAIAWIEDSRSAPVPFRSWLKEFRDDYRARRHYLNEISGSVARMHAYYAVRLLSHAGKALFRKGSQ